MITVLTISELTFGSLLQDWMPGLNSHIELHRYDDKPALLQQIDSQSAVLLCDLERLSDRRLNRIARWADLLEQKALIKVVNSPSRYKKRFDMLRELYERGINRFNVYRFSEIKKHRRQIRFPVFIRRESDHKGPITDLLTSYDELVTAVRSLPLSQRIKYRHDYIVIEFCDCIDADGLFRKFSVLRVGDQFLPRHMLFSENWVTKKPDQVTQALVKEEEAFIANCPHLEQVQQVFEIAGIEYGRIDYGLHQGQMQVWEINTNPIVMPKQTTTHPMRQELQQIFARHCADALLALQQG